MLPSFTFFGALKEAVPSPYYAADAACNECDRLLGLDSMAVLR